MVSFFPLSFTVEKQEALIKLGERIRQLREQNGMTQVELARRCDIEPQNMYRIEKGNNNTTISTLLKISKSLNVSVKSLIEF